MPAPPVPASGYTTAGGLIYRDGVELQLRAINHFGFNAPILQPMHLWEMTWKEQLRQIQGLGFNAIRVPFVPDTIYSTRALDKLSYLAPGNAEFVGKTPIQALDLWMAEADRLGLHILLDFHSVTMLRQYPTWYCNEPDLIYNRKIYTKNDWIRDLVFMAKRYPRLMGIDLYNEPNGVVRWNAGDRNMQIPGNYWAPSAETAAAAVLAANPNLLIFVQGIQGNFDGKENSNLSCNWGENFQPQAYEPLKIPAHKLVLSPHTYGPDVYPKETFKDPAFPKNLAAQWETLFGQFSKAHAVVPGEWGGRYGVGVSEATKKPSGAADVAWQDAFVDYMIAKGMRSSFMWCYTPNSGDTGGLLDDKLQLRDDKMKLLRRLWAGTQASTPGPAPTPPPPTVITITDGTIEIRGTFTVTRR